MIEFTESFYGLMHDCDGLSGVGAGLVEVSSHIGLTDWLLGAFLYF